MARVRGTVKWFSDEKGFGFISRGGGERDVFVHHSEIEKPKGTRVTLREGEEVEFDVADEPRGPKASRVVRVGGGA